MADECRRLLGLLKDPQLRQVAELKMEGYSNEEIAARLGTNLRAVERKLAAIRKRWQDEDQP